MAKQMRVDITDTLAVRALLSRDEVWGPVHLDSDQTEPVAYTCPLCGSLVSRLPNYRQSHIEFHVVMGSCFDGLLKSQMRKF